MNIQPDNTSMKKPRILIYAQRDIYKKVHYRCYLAEFEDLICKMDSVNLLLPKPNKWFQYGTRIAQRLAGDYAIAFNPGIPREKINEDYELFFAFCQFPRDLLHIESIEGWKDRCKTSVCWLSEIWVSQFHKCRYYLKKILSKFDYVILHWSGSVKPLNDFIGDRAIFLPLGIDAVLFCPYPEPPHRFIDIYSIGRRSEGSHRALIKMFEEKEIFYLYDSIIGQDIVDTNQHRLLFANLAKRSKYFIVNPGKIDVFEETKGQSEIGNRYFEGAAAGTIMIGEIPQNEEFNKIFYWPDAVIHLPFDSNNIREIILEYNSQPRRLEAIRRKNVIESLMRHDWAYRWESILNLAGLDPLPGLLERKKQLENLANIIGKEENCL